MREKLFKNLTQLTVKAEYLRSVFKLRLAKEKMVHL